MKCLKVDEYIKQTGSVEETDRLRQELESYVKNGPGLQGRTLCDRVIRACNHQLGVGSPDPDHVVHLVQLVEVSLHGYDVSSALVAQSTPLYMEKIIFHIVKKLSSLEAHHLCSHVAGLLHSRLIPAQQGEDYCVLVRSCFSVLWNGLSASKHKKTANAREKLHCQVQALSFLLLLDTESGSPSVSKISIYTEDAITEFESGCGSMTKDDATFLVKEMHTVFSRCASDGRGHDGAKEPTEMSSVCVVSEMVQIVIKALCKASHYTLAGTLVNEFETKVRDCADCYFAAAALGKWAIKIHFSLKTGGDGGQPLTECARILRALSSDLGDKEAQLVLEGCRLVVWAVESGHGKQLSGPVLLAWFSFLEEHQECLLKTMKKNSLCQAERSRLQQTLCINIYQGFVFAYESLLASQLEDSETLGRVMLYCQATAGLMMTELHKLSNENLLIKAVIAVSNLACGLFNRRLYDQAFSLVEILCKDLCRTCPMSLSVERLSRPFMLAVQTSRRVGQLERALDWVILWLKALGDNITAHMAEPVSLWVKTKIDAARTSEEDLRLRTLRDGFGPDVPDEKVMLCLLEEELRAYKEAVGDTAQERYNTLCDLLEICHEESSHSHLRAVYLCEMAQVVVYQDFSEQTDCTALDFTHEALRLLEGEAETPENADRLKDDKAHALLWHYICNLEKTLHNAIERDKQRELLGQTQGVANPIGTNDFDYEDKQKTEESTMVYEGLHFNLAAENSLNKPLDRALDEWSALLNCRDRPNVRNAKQTCHSIAVMAALFRLMGKPLKALEAYQLVTGLSRQLGDAQRCASSLCQTSSILLDMGSPELAMAQLQQAEHLLSTESAEEPSSLSMFVILLKAQYYYITGQVDRGMPFLCAVLKEANEQRQSKSWYMLRALTLQTCSFYLSLDTSALPEAQRRAINQHGLNSPDTALYESLKLLCSLLVTLVGKGLYGSHGSSSEMRFIGQGDNLVLKWQLLAELLSCSMKMVALRSSCGAINDARLQCLEALKLAIKLQAPSQCAELLVLKAELELMQGEREESAIDLDKVRNLLEICTDFSDQVKKAEVKIKPRKGRPAQKPQSPLPNLDDDCKGILTTRWLPKEPVVKDPTSSPPLKAQPRRWLSSLAHDSNCLCPCCAEPCLGRATARWAAAQADLILQLDPNDVKASLKLRSATLARCKSVSTKLGAKLAKLFTACGTNKSVAKPALMEDVVSRVYLCMVLSGLDPRQKKVSGVWNLLEAGLAFVNATPSPALRPVKAGLTATKAILTLISMADKKGCSPEELFSNAWNWNPPKAGVLMSEEPKSPPPALLIKPREASKNPAKTKEAKKTKGVKPKTNMPSSVVKTKGLVAMTPVAVKSKTDRKDFFDFNTVVPTVTCTPVQRAKGQTLVQKAPRTASKLQFHVYEESSPDQDKVRPVPAAPRRTKKSRFKVEFSDESDTEATTQTSPKQKTQKRSTQRAVPNTKRTQDPPAEKVLPQRQTRGSKKSTAVPRASSSEDDESLACRAASTRRGRGRRDPTRTEGDSLEEPDKMRTIDEEIPDALDISVEQLRTSDTETNPASADNIDVDFEVLRRDICCDLDRDDLSELRPRDPLREGPQTRPSHPDSRPDNLTLEDVQSLLRSAWLSFVHVPSPSIYTTLSSLLALSTGQQDPVTTAMLHAHSIGITSRHRTIRHLTSCLKKLRKASSELAGKMESLTLDEKSPKDCKDTTEQMLLQLEDIFSFPTADSSTFPGSHCREFTQLTQHIPPGVTVCVMSVLGVKPGKMGDSVMLSRFEKGSAPITVHIPTSKQQRPVSWMVQEMDEILAKQKVVSCVSEKAKWWEGRRALDSQVERLLKEMEELLGCWRSLLLPLSSNPELSKHAQHLCRSLSAKGVKVDEDTLKPLLSASSLLSQDDLRRFGLGVSPQWDTQCDHLLHTAASQLADREEPRGHVVLILDKYLQKLPWESTSMLKPHSVSRMPSLHSLIGLCIQKEADSQSLLKKGVDAERAFYVLDPDANLGNSQDRFKEWFSSKPEWEGVCGVAPDSGQLEEAVASKDLYIYVGHGAGARFLDSQAVLKRQMRAASLLFGCSSAALAVRGEQEGQGIILNYLMAGCPFVLGNLWDVTDRDIDRFTKALLEAWFAAGSGAPLLAYMGSSRQATHLKHLIGAAPVVYGLPVHLQ
ncbi:separin isoform X2 [Takifugu flavidus]|uniref:separin isoform X2 n=1 Tax=Takifugu flavidus TaxID=433684 RepID=UPI002544C514|nr:separin isoform X2 [Takifugu flavidus]